MTAVEYLIELLAKEKIALPDYIIKQAKEMQSKQAHDYAKFAIECDRMGMKILNFEDWLKLEK